MQIRRLTTFILALMLAGCGFSVGVAPSTRTTLAEQEAFWTRLTQLCGHAYDGRMTEGTDSVYLRNRVRIELHECTADEVRIGFVIGPDSTREWIVRRDADGLSLRHEMAEPDPDAGRVSGYGGLSAPTGTAARQDFAADEMTARMLPAAAHDVWSLEIDPGRTFAYTLWQPGVARRFRLEFDLSRPAAPGG